MLTREHERAAKPHGWHPTPKQALGGLGVLALIAAMIVLKDAPDVGDLAWVTSSSPGDGDDVRRPQQKPRRRRGRLARWWHGGEDEYEDVVVHPDAHHGV